MTCARIPCYSLGWRWTCWRWSHQEAWSWGFLVTTWRSLDWLEGCTGLVANCSAALSCTPNPSAPRGSWGWYSFWCAARVLYPARVCCRKILVELVRTKPLARCLKTSQRAKVLALDSCFNQFCMYVQLDGLVQKKSILQNTPVDESRVLNSKCHKNFAWEGVLKREVVLPVQRTGSTRKQLFWLKIISLT